jgi:ATP-dependent Clp protease ATP-binding subunit ClpA
LLLKDLNRRLEDQNIKVKMSRKLITHIVDEGFSEEYGARPLRRVIQDTVENTLAEYLLKEKMKDEKNIKEIKLDIEGDKVVIV